MKLNVLYISFAIGLLAHSSQAAPIVGDVAQVSDESVGVPVADLKLDANGINANNQDSDLTYKKRQVNGAVDGAEKLVQDVSGSPDGVDAPLEGTSDFAEKTVSDLGGVSQLKQRALLKGDDDDAMSGGSGIGGGLVSGVLRKRQQLPGGLDLAGTVKEALGVTGLGKRSPLLDNQGDNSRGAAGGGLVGSGNDNGDAGLVNGLLKKRLVDDMVKSAVGVVGGQAGILRRDEMDSNLVDGTVSDASKVVDPVEMTVQELKVDETVGNVADVEKVVGGLPVDTSAVTGMVGGKRDGSNDDDGDDIYRHYPPNGATYGSGMAANRPADYLDAMTKRSSEEDEGDDDESRNGENKQDHPGPPPPGLTDEQLDDYFTKRDAKPNADDDTNADTDVNADTDADSKANGEAKADAKSSTDDDTDSKDKAKADKANGDSTTED